MTQPAVAQLAHVEILTAVPDRTLWFFRELLGMEETTRSGRSVYLRAYEDFYHHTLVVTEAAGPGLGHIAWRTASAEALQDAVRRLEAGGYGCGWSDGGPGHGPAYRFQTPDGHPMELVWEVEYYRAPEEMRTALRNRPQKRPLRGVPVRRLDHVNLMAGQVAPVRQFLQEYLGFRLREQKIGERGVEVGAWLSVSPLVHEIAVMRDAAGQRGRFHHVAFWYGYPQHLLDAADVFNDYGVRIEAGPGKHGTTQAYFLYAFEPGGTRVELFGDTGYLIFDPTWRTVVWDVATESDLEKSSIWFGGRLPETFYTYGTPSGPLQATAV
ncbi:MAG: catechol 2,3-dioxygenase [Armatimonadota bacterium]|nr:catechol 2,3-dioxygenase [Armatimonadota bacterium]MDR7559654.1 catechol 2,3-dioxygenase [Armatimonadota bacterium]MDR7577121.1 catechol 2,3-dioxygenase [Armatimonadota bacterium]MDR7587230.1 catechol 2,3-dioxygenase [Armatimonadota bacterium]MDR7611191.1 catechol 2,3-dioxygenase [Armatimonadota bacterium]